MSAKIKDLVFAKMVSIMILLITDVSTDVVHLKFGKTTNVFVLMVMLGGIINADNALKAPNLVLIKILAFAEVEPPFTTPAQISVLSVEPTQLLMQLELVANVYLDLFNKVQLALPFNAISMKIISMVNANVNTDSSELDQPVLTLAELINIGMEKIAIVNKEALELTEFADNVQVDLHLASIKLCAFAMIPNNTSMVLDA